MSPEERGLFRERIMFLDRKLLPGLTKITWSQTQVAEQFQLECRANISKVRFTQKQLGHDLQHNQLNSKHLSLN